MQTIAGILLAGALAGAAAPTPAERVVYLAGGLPDDGLVRLGAAVAARPGTVLLIDGRGLTPYLRHFLSAYRPCRVVPVGTFPGRREELQRCLGVPVETPLALDDAALWQRLFPDAEHVVVCRDRPRRLLLRAAALAGASGAPLWVCRGKSATPPLPRRWRVRSVTLVGDVRMASPPGADVTRLRDEWEVAQAHRTTLAGRGAVVTAVVTNPDDIIEGRAAMSALAPWLAVSKRAALVFTGPTGVDAAQRVERAARDLPRLETLILAASQRALPVVRRPNPIPADKDPLIEMEPLTPSGAEPFSYAVGRLFHDDRAVVPLMLARQRLLLESSGPRRAVVASNPGGGLELLEAFSRNTARELVNGGYRVTGLFGDQLNGRVLRRAMVGAEVFLWEGHHNTLVRDWGFTTWDEPMPPVFVFLQSCLALRDDKVRPLLSRGAFAVVGTSTRTYSGSGGALSLAFFNAALYDGHDLGGALRQAKNFLVAYALLKEKRLGPAAARVGANHRAAWAFTLWGDPTFRLPPPEPPAAALSAVRHAVKGRHIIIDLPEQRHSTVTSSKYRVEMRPNGRLAGLIRKPSADLHPLVPFVFAEVRLSDARPGQTPRLRTSLPGSHWLWLYDARRQTGYLLATPRERDTSLRFQVEWPGPSVVGRSPAR